MYATLDRIDIVTKATETKRAAYVLTDHRTSAEVQSEPELSVLFALTRVGAARVMGDREGGVDVTYFSREAPPGFLHEAVTSAGGVLMVEAEAPPPAPSTRPVGDIADDALRGLARRTAERDGGALDAALLTRLEDQTLLSPPKQEDAEDEYWARTLELAAVCGELLRVKTGGRWTDATDGQGLFPFTFTAGNATFNVADKAHRFMGQGESQRPSQLLLMADDVERPDEGPIMVSLKPGHFPREQGVCRELLKGPGPGRSRTPLVFVGRDHPHTFSYLPAGSPDADRSFEEGLANLARLDLEAEPHTIAGVEVLVVSGDFYASEKILDREFMKGLHRRLDAELLAAAVPQKGVLLVTHQVAAPAILGFAAAAQALHEKAEGAALSPTVFLVKQGEVAGYLGTEEEKSGKPPGAAPRTPGSRRRTASRKQGSWSHLLRPGH